MMYGKLDEYLSAFAKNPDLAVVPIPLVADHFGISSAGVSAMLKDGRLEGLRVGRNPFVLIKSLSARKAARDEKVQAVEEYLRGIAKKQFRNIFYEPVMNIVDLDWKIPAHRGNIGGILGDVSRKSAKDHPRNKLMLSVLVHKKTSGTTRPGEGFFELAEELGHNIPDDKRDEFVRHHTDLVLKAYR